MSHLKGDGAGQVDTNLDDGYVVWIWSQDDGWEFISSSKDGLRVEPKHLRSFVDQAASKGKLVVVLPRDGTLPQDWEHWEPMEARPTLKLFRG